MQRPLNYSGSATSVYVVMYSVVFFHPSIHPSFLLLLLSLSFCALHISVFLCLKLHFFPPLLPISFCFSFSLHCSYIPMGGPGSSVGIATELWAGRSGIESRWGRDFPPVQTGPWTHPASCKVGTWSFTGVKCGRGVLLTTHPPSSAAVMEE